MNQVLSTHIPLVRSMSIPVNALRTLPQGHILQIGDPPALKSSSCDDIQFGWHGCSGSIDYPYLNIKYGSDPSARVCRSRRLFLSRRTVARCRRMPRLIAGAAQPFTDMRGRRSLCANWCVISPALLKPKSGNHPLRHRHI